GKQWRVIHGEATGGCHQAPEPDADAEHGAADGALSQARDRYAEQGVEDRESGAAEQAELEVAQAEFFLDRLLDDADDDAIDEVEGVNDEERPEDVSAIVLRAVALKGRRRRIGHEHPPAYRWEMLWRGGAVRSNAKRLPEGHQTLNFLVAERPVRAQALGVVDLRVGRALGKVADQRPMFGCCR